MAELFYENSWRFLADLAFEIEARSKSSWNIWRASIKHKKIEFSSEQFSMPQP